MWEVFSESCEIGIASEVSARVLTDPPLLVSSSMGGVPPGRILPSG